MAEDWRAGGFGLYVHWPFCAAKCPYCDFNSHVSRDIDQGRWRRAYLAEIDRVGRLTADRRLDTVFFGGGTPSLMDPDLVAAILDRVRRTWKTDETLEVTLEANPTSVEAGRFRAYGAAGVTRLSMGVQALNDEDLARLGRQHSAAEARAAFDVARSVFDRVSFDLIYARQHQTLEGWRAELSEALEMAVDHLSLYQLTLEPGTAFAERAARGGLRGLPDEPLGADMYELTQEICAVAGMHGYEISNHARPGAESRHNLIYWRYGDYAGIGPGAHGRLTLGTRRIGTDTELAPDAWLDMAERGHGWRSTEPLAAADEAAECLMMGLRLREGVSLSRLASLDPNAVREESIEELAELGLVERADDWLRATDSGRLLLNGVIRQLLSE
ncbi:radical SAM family heme chaperone HemW [Rhodosalinus sp. K401]|uniref:radical SAM family heme chaperone HemW n=1 Tax=Rhodosalinus sp. K401 TaxID=3239195 RepID=UPI0035268FA5